MCLQSSGNSWQGRSVDATALDRGTLRRDGSITPCSPPRPPRGAPPMATEPALDFMRLMWAVDHELQRVSKRMIGRLGLTAPQRLALRLIGREPGLTPGVLAGLLHLHPGTVTGIVRRLQSAGLISRVRSSGDTRRVHLELT